MNDYSNKMLHYSVLSLTAYSNNIILPENV